MKIFKKNISIKLFIFCIIVIIYLIFTCGNFLISALYQSSGKIFEPFHNNTFIFASNYLTQDANGNLYFFKLFLWLLTAAVIRLGIILILKLLEKLTKSSFVTVRKINSYLAVLIFTIGVLKTLFLPDTFSVLNETDREIQISRLSQVSLPIGNSSIKTPFFVMPKVRNIPFDSVKQFYYRYWKLRFDAYHPTVNCYLGVFCVTRMGDTVILGQASNNANYSIFSSEGIDDSLNAVHVGRNAVEKLYEIIGRKAPPESYNILYRVTGNTRKITWKDFSGNTSKIHYDSISNGLWEKNFTAPFGSTLFLGALQSGVEGDSLIVSILKDNKLFRSDTATSGFGLVVLKDVRLEE